MSANDLSFASISEISRLFRKRKLSPVELTKWLLERIEQQNPNLNAYLTVTPELALAQAKKAESELFSSRGRKPRRDRGPLHGIPISLKDNIYTAGIRTTAGAQFLKNHIPPQDARVVTQLKEAGAVLLGKTNLHEFAYGVTTNNPHYGPTRNPWDRARIPGGSSGGSAAAVAAGLCFASVGTDTGGSIRIPASLCGIVGIKPSLHRVSVEGVVPLSSTLDCVGTLARSVEDTAFLLDAIFARRKGEPLLARQATSTSKRKFALGIPKEFFLEVLAPEVRAAFESSLAALRKAGCKTKELSIPLLKATEDAGNQIAWPEATHFHQQAGWFPHHSADYGEDVRSRLEMGTKVAATTYFEALALREKFIQEFHRALSEASVDALAVPTSPIAAPLIGEETTSIDAQPHPTRALLLRLNRPANLAGVPAISVPCGLSSSRLPLGLQLIGPSHSEPLLVQLARRIEELLPSIGQPTI